MTFGTPRYCVMILCNVTGNVALHTHTHTHTVQMHRPTERPQFGSTYPEEAVERRVHVSDYVTEQGDAEHRHDTHRQLHAVRVSLQST